MIFTNIWIFYCVILKKTFMIVQLHTYAYSISNFWFFKKKINGVLQIKLECHNDPDTLQKVYTFIPV